ncbi:MAG: hypothetical protein ACJ8CR_34860 [Roseiflexaceae bacterium]
MSEQQHHMMCRVYPHASGAEEWFCATCGRRFLLRWTPMYQKTVLDPGDEQATHSGSCGGLATGQLSLGISSVMQTNVTDHSVGFDPSPDPAGRDETELTDALRPWLKALREAGLDT